MIPRWPAFALLLAGLPLGMTGAPMAQQAGGTPLERGTVISPVLTIDTERVFTQSAFGQRVAADAEAKGTALAAENRRIEADLETEERALTEKRPTMSPEEFRDLADAFDDKVQEVRATQLAKGRAISEDIEREREIFLAAAAPVLERLMRDAGAAVILERRSVFVSASAIEITEDAIALIDAALGSGAEDE